MPPSACILIHYPRQLQSLHLNPASIFLYHLCSQFSSGHSILPDSPRHALLSPCGTPILPVHVPSIPFLQLHPSHQLSLRPGGPARLEIPQTKQIAVILY